MLGYQTCASPSIQDLQFVGFYGEKDKVMNGTIVGKQAPVTSCLCLDKSCLIWLFGLSRRSNDALKRYSGDVYLLIGPNRGQSVLSGL